MNIYNEEKEIQDRVASAYDSVYGSLIAYEDRWTHICNQIKSESTFNDKILEIGCGTATLLHNLEKQGFNCLNGFDLSDEVIKEAKHKVPNADFKVANMIKMPYSDNEFNIVIFNGSLHHVPHNDIKLAIAESYRILKEGGTMIIADSNDEFDSFKPMFIIKVIRKLISIKNHFLKKQLWKFNPSDEKNYTFEHVHKSIIDYINFSMNDSDYTLVKQDTYEHFITQFEGSLMTKSLFDRALFKLLKFMDNKISINPTSQVLLFFLK